MKILLIYNRYEYRGGEDTYVDNLAIALKNAGHSVIPYFKDSRSIHTFWDKVFSAIGLFWNVQTAQEIKKLINKHKPDVAHIHNIYPLISPTVYYICKKKGVKIVQTIHNYKFMCPKNSLFRNGKICELCINKSFFYPSIIFSCYHNSRIASLIYSISFFLHRHIGAFNFVDTYIFPSIFTRDLYVKYAKIPRSKMVVLPHFVDKNNHSLPIKKSGDYFLYLGRLTEEKGVTDLLDSFTRLPTKKLKVYGSGELQNTLSKKYSQYGNITLKKSIEHKLVFSLLQNAIAVVVPSRWYEVFPMVIAEAITYNKPLLIRRTKNSIKLFSNIPGITLYGNNQLEKLINKTNFDRMVVNYSAIQKTLLSSFHINNLIKIYYEK